MERHNNIARMADRVAFFMLADRHPDDIFSDAFSAVREKARDFKDSLEQKARDSLQDSLIKDLKDRGFDVVSVEIKLGKYRGSRFVTSARVTIRAKTNTEAKSVLEILKRYHQRYNMKSFDDGIGIYNIR